MSSFNPNADSDFNQFRAFLKDISGITLGEGKQFLVKSRLKKIMLEQKTDSLAALMRRAQLNKRNGVLMDQIIDAMTTRETLWFRDNHPFEILKNHILPEFSKEEQKSLRVWSSACSSGQEPYSISIIIKEYLAGITKDVFKDVEIMATDISPAALDEAKEGVYSKIAVSRGLSEARRARFFTPKESDWQIKDEIRKVIIFKELNLRNSYLIFGKFDVIFCRNVLIYFSDDIKQDILTRLAKALNPGGYLFVGGSESVNMYVDKFKQVKTGGGVANRLKN
tara:strand:- start:3466 stop:4305 length:840 start_codon:yes stop_codon:yes gene_type:complete